MNMELNDGTVIQDGLNFSERMKNFQKEPSYIPFPVKAHVLRTYPLDADENREGETYVCDVYVPRFGIPLYSVPFLLDKADYDNYVHYSPIAAERNLDFSIFDQTRLDSKKHNGTVVLVQFVNADIKQPVIVKVFPHNLSGRKDGFGLGHSPDPRPGNEEDGENYRIRYNGTNFSIDKDGNVTIDQSETTDLDANHDKKIFFKLAHPLLGLNQALEFEMDNTEGGKTRLSAFDFIAGNVQQVIFDAEEQTIEILSENNFGENSIKSSPDGVEIINKGALNENEIVLNDDGMSFTTSVGKFSWIADADVMEFKSIDTAILIDGINDNINLKTAFGDELDVSRADGIKATTPSGTLLHMKNGAIDAEGTGGKLKLEGGLVAMGSAAAELLDLIDKTLQQLDTTMAQIQLITVPTAVGPSGPPNNAAAFATVQTQLAAVKTSLGLIKGSL